MINRAVQLWLFLSGKKTYLVAFAGAIYATGIDQGLWHHNPAVDVLLSSLAAATIRHGISSQNSETPKS